MVSVVTIGGSEYRLRFGMLAAERIAKMSENGQKELTNIQTLTAIIWYGHENWCDDNDVPFTLAKSEVINHIEDAFLISKDLVKQKELADVGSQFAATRFIADIAKEASEPSNGAKKKKIGANTGG